MKSHVRVAVIGGGIVGCSVLYHLTKLGWSDVCLIERSELTSGSTWHAAGGMHTLNSDPNVAKLQDYTIRLYKELEEISGQSCSIHLSGGFMLADTPERMDFLKMAVAKGKYLGMESELVSMDEVKRANPLIETQYFLGAMYDPFEGHVDPSGVTHAYAKAARMAGAEVYRFNPVIELIPTADGGWTVVTEKGTIEAEMVVNAGGLWAREVGRMVGLELPILAMEHQFLITEDIPEVKALDREMPHFIDFGGEAYLRQEGHGLVLGTYEQACVPWSPRTTPMDFGHELLQPDLDRIAPSLEVAFKHFPCLATAGIKQVINGPFTFAGDGNPLVGPVPGLRNYFVACGVMAGMSQGGGVGLSLAQWMIEGEPGMDIFAMDVARYGDFATRGFTNTKVQENYKRRFNITFPNEELPAARPLRTTPIYDRLKARNAVFGAGYGLEHALWFAPEGTEPFEEPTFRRSNAFAPVAAECRAVREGVGLLEISNFAKYEVTGPGAADFLDGLFTARLPEVGKLKLSPMLSTKGRLIGDFTIARRGPEMFMLIGSGVAEAYHMRWFGARMPESGVRLDCKSSAVGGLAVAGPKARELVSRLTDEDVSAEAFPFLTVRDLDLGELRATIGRISFTGELGFEIWVGVDYLLALYEMLTKAGAELGLTLFGGRALQSLRLEKSFGAFTREYTSDYTPFEAGLGRFVSFKKGGFVGHDAALEAKEKGPRWKLSTFVVDDDGVDALANEPIHHDGNVVGWVTSGGYGHVIEKSIALGYVPADLAEPGGKFEIVILGDPRPATLVGEPLYDPAGGRMRS